MESIVMDLFTFFMLLSIIGNAYSFLYLFLKSLDIDRISSLLIKLVSKHSDNLYRHRLG